MRQFFSTLFILALIFNAVGQVPLGFNYQGVARDNSGNPLSDTNLGVKVSILDGSASGEEVYSETHAVSTNDIGLFSIIIGDGNVASGSFENIDWSVGKYLEISMDMEGGSDYEKLGTVELLSVPYALYSDRSGGDADADPENEIQDIFLEGSQLSISEGSTVELSGLIEDDDPDSTNEIQDISLLESQLTISEGSTVDLSVINTDSQTLELDSTTLSISNGNYIKLDSISSDDQTLNEVLSQGADAGGVVISNIGDPVNDQDAVPKSYVDALIARIESLEEQVGNPQPILWNKLGSIAEVETSETGPAGVIAGTVNFDHDVKFGKGLTPNTGDAGSGVDFPTTIVDPEKGCVEMWVQFYADPVAFSYGVYGFINVAHWRPGGDGDPHNVMMFGWHNSNSSLTFNGTSRGVLYENFDPALNTPVHIACVWDRQGIDSSGDYMRIYVDGTMVTSGNTENDWGTDNTAGEFRIAAPWDSDFATDRYSVDNIKVWDYAKTDFSDRNTE